MGGGWGLGFRAQVLRFWFRVLEVAGVGCAVVGRLGGDVGEGL